MHPYNDRPYRSRKQAWGPVSWLTAALLAAVPATGSFVQDAWSAQLDEANVFFELNNTDGDLGIHALIDGEAWELLEIQTPDRRILLSIEATEEAREQGITELFFESAEPTFDELSPEAFFLRFPEGMYRVSAETLEGPNLRSKARVTHLMPAPPANVRVNGIPAAPDCDAETLPEVSSPVTISWDAVTMSHPDLGRSGEPITAVLHQVVVEVDETPFVYSVHLPPTVTSVMVPDEIIGLSDELKFEILTREASGNQTAVESCFEVAE